MPPTKLAAIAAALLLACAAPGPAAAADSAVVLSATAPGYAPGMVIGPADRLRLPEGASLTLLLRSGQMLKLRGPTETALDRVEPARPDAPALAEAFRLRGIDATAIGGTRAASAGRRLPRAGEVAVEIERSGTWCVGAADTVWLMRPAAEPAELGLRRRGSLRRLAWPAGAARVEWPAELPVEDGDRVEVLADGRPLATLTFRTAVATGGEAAEIAGGLLLGCREQYAPALRQLARAHLAPELWLGTDRGPGAAYAPGERIGLMVMADSEGWLYCVTRRSDGAAMAVFPAGAVGGAALAAAVPAALHGHRQSVALTAGPPGMQRVACWLADRDIGPELPQALLDASGARLPYRMAADLDAIFAGLGGRLARASLDVRVE
ncbi:hypothetical protein [Roseicella aquatilis]|uniref:DUF4384 domain-containing protein n=1 Tax=Roseicella aquatilis TaxID=2527868 RepID=A0A4R4DQS2_9PROT|nr:hypothetical protein [Roseicella aquatilis]TCZ63256.1 hypothetical protein EXY23_10525 [Roseicella aquatilis]